MKPQLAVFDLGLNDLFRSTGNTEPRRTIGVRFEQNRSGFRSNGTDIPPPILPCHSQRKL